MSDVMALDIETENYSHEIGGWNNTHMFEPTVVATWNGSEGIVYCNKSEAKKFLPDGVVLKELHPETLGKDLSNHIAKGGRIVGHNLMNFDLPVLRDSLDCWAAGDALSKSKEHIIDTSVLLRSAARQRIPLSDACRHTLGSDKIMRSEEAPIEWRKGNYGKVAEYCLKDAQLSYELWNHGHQEGFVKARCRESGVVTEYEVTW